MSAEGSSVGDVDPAEAGNLWRTEIALRVRELRHRLEVCADGGGESGDSGGGEAVAVAARMGPELVGVAIGAPSATRTDGARRARHAEAAREALDDADAAIRLVPSPPDRIRRWWNGQTITAAWESIHRAEAELVEISSEADALATLPQLRAWMRQVLADRDELAAYEREFETAVNQHRVDRTMLRRAHQDAIAANVDWHSSMRTFRNILFSVAAALTALLAGLAVWHAIDADVVSLCRTVGDTLQCFGDNDRPSSAALFEVLLVGAIGGLLGSAFLLGRSEHAPARYNLLIPQIVLKAVTGAATALVGVILVQAHVFVAPVGGLSTAVLLAYAAVFGFSQQLLTRFVDQRGEDLLNPRQDGARER